jgi:hypothetical protein
MYQPFRLVLLSDLSSERKIWPRFFLVLSGLGEKEEREVLKLMGVGGTYVGERSTTLNH